MSRFRRSTNDFGGDDLAYGDAPNRWDRDRFESLRNERDRPRADVLVEERFERRAAPPPRDRFRATDYYEEDHYEAPSRLPPRPRRSDRELFGEQDPRDIAERALAPYRRNADADRDLVVDIERRRVVRDDAGPRARPGLLRRQSSLDTFDRRPQRRYDDDYRLPPNIDIPLPRRSASRRRPFIDEEYEDIRYRERDEPTDYREVEIVRERDVVRRGRRGSDEKSAKSVRSAKSRKSRKSAAKSVSVRSSSSSSSSSETVITRMSSPSPDRKIGKKGRTRMPKRLVRREVLVNLEYPFVGEEDFYVVTRALGKEHIDEVIRLSEEYKEPKTMTYRYEEDQLALAPIAPPPPNEHYETLRTEWINPPSVRAPSIRAPSPARTIRTRKPSPARTVRTARSMSRAPSPPPVQERIIIQQAPAPQPVYVQQAPPPPQVVHAPAVPQAPMQIYLPERRERSQSELRAEIRALEAEQRALRVERESHHSHRDLVIRQPAENYEVVEYRPRAEERKVVEYVERERERSPKRDVVRVEKDRKGRMALVRSAH